MTLSRVGHSVAEGSLHCSNGTLARKKTTSPRPSTTERARACRVTVRRAAGSRQESRLGCWELRTRGGVGQARRGELRRRRHPPPCIHETGPQTRPHDGPKRCVSGDGERSRKASAGGIGEIQTQGGVGQASNKTRTHSRSQRGRMPARNIYCKFGVTQTRQHWSVGVGRHPCTGTMSLTDRHTKATPRVTPF